MAAEKSLRHRKFPRRSGVDPDVEQSSLVPSPEAPVRPTVDAPSRRASTAGAARSARAARTSDRRSKLSSLVAELSAAAATIEEGGELEALTAHLRLPADPLRLQPVDELDLAALTAPAAVPMRPEVHLTGRRDGVAAPVDTAPADRLDAAIAAEDAAETPAAETADTDGLRMSVQLEIARAEAEVMSNRVESELAARIAAEKRLADAQDELRFLRAEIQMVGHEKRRPAGPLRRALLAITGRRRPVVPANNPKKERLRLASADTSARRWE